MTLDLPRTVVDTVRTVFGERGKRWLATLPTMVARQCRDGAAHLYDFDPDSGALLLEWARPGTPLVAQPRIPLEGRTENAGRIHIACALYRRLRRPPVDIPAGTRLSRWSPISSPDGSSSCSPRG